MSTAAALQVESPLDLLDRLFSVLRTRPVAELQRIGGEIGLVLVGATHAHWTIRLGATGVVVCVPGLPKKAVARFAVRKAALRWLIEGRLDLGRALADRRAQLEGDRRAIEALVACCGGVALRPVRRAPLPMARTSSRAA